MLVDDTHGRLGLGSEAYPFCHYGAAVGENRLFISVHITLSLFLGVKEKIEFRIFILEIQLQHLFAVIDLLALRILDSESIIQSILHIVGVVLRIGIFLVKYLLDRRILRGINTQSAAVHQVLGLCSCISLDVHQVVDHLIDQFVLEI